jgi:putative Ig domain-containing protein/VCBS repeat protein/glucodextranase-like protein
MHYTHVPAHKAVCFIASLCSMILFSLPAFAQAPKVTALWDSSPATDQVTGYQICIGTSSLSCNIGLANVSNADTSYAFPASAGVLQYVAIRATNATGVSPFSSELTFSIPSFAQPANQSSAAGAAISPLNLSITDPDSSPLTITHTGLPVGLGINNATRQITGIPSAAGNYNVTVLVTDGLATVSRSFAWTVTAPVPDTLAPTLTISSHTPGQTVNTASVTIAGAASDDTRGGRGITSVKVNGLAAAGGSAVGNDVASWSRSIDLSAGANTISVEATDGAGNLILQQLTLNRTTEVCRIGSDFNGDCKADLLWRNSATNQSVVWYLNGTTLIGASTLPTVPDPTWKLAATADFNRDGSPDLIWRNPSTGQNVVWYLRGTTYLRYDGLPTLVGAAWQLVAAVDVNRDGSPDLIWRNPSTGQNVVWYFNGKDYQSYASFPSLSGQAWQLAAAADINKDGTPDLVWYNSATGQNAVWYMIGTSVVDYRILSTVPDLNWRLMTALDVNNDGAADLIWRYSDGSNYVSYLTGSNGGDGALLPGVSDPAWKILGTR